MRKPQLESRVRENRTHGSEGGEVMSLPYPYVRLRWRTVCAVRVRAGVSHDPVAEGNCVAARRGGEQPEANWQSVGDEPDSAVWRGEPAHLWRSPKTVGPVEDGEANEGRAPWCGWGRNAGKAGRRKRGYLPREATLGRSQNPHSTASGGRGGQGEDIVAPAGNQPGNGEDEPEPKPELEAAVKGG
jgi:hypothetical protein